MKGLQPSSKDPGSSFRAIGIGKLDQSWLIPIPVMAESHRIGRWTSTTSSRAFSRAAPSLWNGLHESARLLFSHNIFKAEPFRQAFFKGMDTVVNWFECWVEVVFFYYYYCSAIRLIVFNQHHNLP